MAVDEKSVVEAVGTLPLVGNEEGLIPAFGLYLTRHYSAFYNRISFAALHHAERSGSDDAANVREALIEAGHVCAFNTFGGIMMSQEWEAVVGPMLESHEDWVHGIVAIVNALGWGKWRIEELVGKEKLRVAIGNSYESEGYLADYPRRASGGVCFLATGGVAGIMNLLYHGDITRRPALDAAYYKKLFEGQGRFHAVETQCRASGAPHCEIVAKRS